MKANNQIIICLIVVIFTGGCTNFKQINPDGALSEDANGNKTDSTQQQFFKELKIKDSLLFELGFNRCDTHQVRITTSHDFEFYHDQAGITESQDAFIKSIAELCNLPYKASRELVENSLEVHLLEKNGVMYGAIQQGKHKFYAKEPGKEKYLTSAADFIHLWIIEGNDWKLKRVFSYNHKEAE